MGSKTRCAHTNAQQSKRNKEQIMPQQESCQEPPSSALQATLDERIQEQLQGGGRRARNNTTSISSTRTRGQRTTITNLTYQLNMIFYFISGSSDINIASLQNNASGNSIAFKLLTE